MASVQPILAAPHILQDLSPPLLVQAIEANCLAMWMDRARSPRLEWHDDPDCRWLISDYPLPAANTVLWADFPDRIEARVAAVLASYRARRLPMTWWIGPSTRPADLGRYLEAQGLKLWEDEPGMAADLLALPREAPAAGELEFDRVGDDRTLQTWVRTFAKAFGLRRPWQRVVREIEAGLGLGPEQPRQMYLGRWRGKPVATSLLFLGAGVAGLYALGTVPRARGQGVGTAMTLATLGQARAMGYRVAILFASRMGHPLYRRLGFREYCRPQEYVWEP